MDQDVDRQHRHGGPGVSRHDGQRKGLPGGYAEPMFVLAIRPDQREVVIGPRSALAASTVVAGGANWLADSPLPGEELGVRIRHGAPIVPARVLACGPDGFEVELSLPQDAVTPGQSAVLYRDEIVLGGGVIYAANPANGQCLSPSTSASCSSAALPSSDKSLGTWIVTRTS